MLLRFLILNLEFDTKHVGSKKPGICHVFLPHNLQIPSDNNGEFSLEFSNEVIIR
jgi:hypothetical protein